LDSLGLAVAFDLRDHHARVAHQLQRGIHFVHLRGPHNRFYPLHTASTPFSPVRILMASDAFMTKIFPSPTFPVNNASRMTSITLGTSQSLTTRSTRTFGIRVILSLVNCRSGSPFPSPGALPCCRPNPLIFVTVMPRISSSSLSTCMRTLSDSGRIIAEIIFMLYDFLMLVTPTYAIETISQPPAMTNMMYASFLESAFPMAYRYTIAISMMILARTPRAGTTSCSRTL